MRQLFKFKKIQRETEGKHNQNTKTRRETKKNKEKHGKIGLTENVAYCVLPERGPKPKHTEMGLQSHTFLCFSAVSKPFPFCFFYFVVFSLYFHSVYHLKH